MRRHRPPCSLALALALAGLGLACDLPLGARSGAAASASPVQVLVEPYAEDDVAGNLNPVGRVYYGFSTFLCVPHAISEHATDAMGSQAGEARTREIVTAAGFTRFRRVAETPFNLVYEVRP